MNLTLKEFAEQVGGSFEGDPDLRITGVGPIEDARPGQVAFLANEKYARHLATTRASAVLVRAGAEAASPAALVRVADPYFAFASLLPLVAYRPTHPAPGLSPGAFADATARVAPDAIVYPGAYVGPEAEVGARTILYPGVFIGEQARVGEDCILYANVAIAHGCVVGDRVILHPGVSIGADGFGHAKTADGFMKIPQVGNAVVEDDVEIGANSCVDRATMGATVIARGARLDDLVMVGHNCRIGEGTAIVAQAGVSGSTKIGRDCVIGPQAGVLGHLQVGDNTVIVGQSAVRKSIQEGGVYGGTPTQPYPEWRQNVIAGLRAADVRKRVLKLERELERLRKLLESTGGVD
ncbi:MAG: UDP-3-O-(3-hydroxymyristoyl)glucosamine N-acyltransferase [Myxococcales bacterium]|nr:UDP-3-O-(3-hydroxymyristoyl)glucosamine N-acyltransferase [Myxococcales bacterium]